MASDDPDDPELRDLAKLEELKERYGSTMSQAAYNKRLKAIMNKYTYQGGAGDADGSASSGIVAPRGKYLWGQECESYEKVSKAKEFKDFSEAKAMLKDIEDKEWKRDATAPGNTEWRRFVVTVGKVETIAKITKVANDKFKCQVGKMQFNVTEEDEEEEEDPEPEDKPPTEEVEAQAATAAASPSRPKRDCRKSKDNPEASEVPASVGEGKKARK